MEPYGLLEALEYVVALIGEDEPLASKELADDVRSEDLAAFSGGGDAGGSDDGGTEEVVALGDRLAGVNADPHPQGFVADLIVGGKGPLEGDRAFDGTCR